MKIVYLGLGCVFLGLGALGVILPILPTTPFLLLSIFFFARSSDKMRAFVLDHPIFGRYVRDYYDGTMPRGQKVRVISLLWVTILISAYLIDTPITWVVLPLIALAVSIHIWLLRPRGERGR